MGAAIKEIIHYKTIRGKFSSVHPDLAAEGITRVEVGEEGLHFISDQQPGDLIFSTLMPASGDEDEDEMLKRAIAMSLEEHSREDEEEAEDEEEMLARALALSLMEE